jgi:acetyl-CoA acetyltransferase
MHPWGRWGRPFLSYATEAVRVAIEDAGVDLREVGFLAAAGSVRCGYPGQVAAATLSRMLGLRDVEAVTVYGACASGVHALAVARDRVLTERCEVALVVGADVARAVTHEDGSETEEGIPHRAWLGLRAARRMHEHGTTAHDLHRVRIKNSTHGAANIHARFRMPLSESQIELSPLVASPLRLLHVSTFSDGAAAVVIGSTGFAQKRRRSGVQIRAINLSTMTDENLEMPYLSARAPEEGNECGRARNVAGTLREAGIAPEELSLVELYDVSSVSELDWYEHIGLCTEGEGEALLRSGATTLGGKTPVNVSGGLTSFGEAVSAQALAQVCELAWQMQGRCGARQVEGARTGLAACDGLYGHVASVVLST